MRSLSNLGIGLSLVFGCLLLALVAELYYLLWWKRRIVNGEIEEDYSSGSARELFYLFCWKEPSSTLSSTVMSPQQLICHGRAEPDTQLHLHSSSSKDLLLKQPYGEEVDSVEAELMRMHNLSGPPRFLFPIKEETKEDLESEDGKSRSGDNKSRKGSRNRSLSDILLKVETPFMTPMSSPPFFTPPLTPNNYNHHGFNPLFESSATQLKSSPPPKFKFLKDAEEKLHIRILMEEEAEKEAQKLPESSIVMKAPSTSSSMVRDVENGFLSQ